MKFMEKIFERRCAKTYGTIEGRSMKPGGEGKNRASRLSVEVRPVGKSFARVAPSVKAVGAMALP